MRRLLLLFYKKRIFLKLILISCILPFNAVGLEPRINWEKFLMKHDLVWDTYPYGYHQGAFLGNGLVGTMVYALGRDFAFTSVNLNCDFLHPARVGEILLTKGKVIRAGKNIVHVEGQITNAEGKIVAKCTSNLIQTSLKLAF